MKYRLLLLAEQYKDLICMTLINEQHDVVLESVELLKDKLGTWLDTKKISADEVGYIISGLDIVTSKARNKISTKELEMAEIHPDIRNIKVLGNVALNNDIRQHIIKVGRTWGNKRANNISHNLKNDMDGKYLNKLRTAIGKMHKRIKALNYFSTEKTNDVIGSSSTNKLIDKHQKKLHKRQPEGQITTGFKQKTQPDYVRYKWIN